MIVDNRKQVRLRGNHQAPPVSKSSPISDCRQLFYQKAAFVPWVFVMVCLLLFIAAFAGEARAHFITIHFDDLTPGKYHDLTTRKVRFKARGTKGFQIAPLNRKNVSKQVLIVPKDEIVDIYFDKKFGAVTGIGLTIGLVNPGGGEEARFGTSVRYPWNPAGIHHSRPFPLNTTIHAYQPSDDEVWYSFEMYIGKGNNGHLDGLDYHFSFGPRLGVVDNQITPGVPHFQGQPGFGCRGGTGKGAFFDNLTLEVAVGEAIPYMLRGSHQDKIDLIFMADKGYRGRFDSFFEDLFDLVENGFEKNDAFKKNRGKFNLYYIKKEAQVFLKTGYVCPSHTNPPKPWTNWGGSFGANKGFSGDFPFVDGVPILQRSFWGWGQSCPSLANGGGVFWLDSSSIKHFFHEAGHGLFHLAGEYCGDDGTDRFPYPNIWSTEQQCRTNALSQGWNPDDCTGTCSGSGPWKIDKNCAMQKGSDIQYGPACMRNVNYYFGTKK
jgi:hypothetical protein